MKRLHSSSTSKLAKKPRSKKSVSQQSNQRTQILDLSDYKTEIGSLGILKDFKGTLKMRLSNAKQGFIKNSYNFQSLITRYNKYLIGPKLPVNVTRFDDEFPNRLHEIMMKALKVNNQIMMKICNLDSEVELTLTR